MRGSALLDRFQRLDQNLVSPLELSSHGVDRVDVGSFGGAVVAGLRIQARQVGEAVEIFVNDRLVARGEIVLVENRLGVTMTEIVKAA